MWYYITKVLISSLLIVLISEISKRSSLIGSIMASIPLVSVIGMIWLYKDTKDLNAVSALSKDIFWLVIPSLSFFILFPILVKKGMTFTPALLISLAVMIVFYFIMVALLKQMHIL